MKPKQFFLTGLLIILFTPIIQAQIHQNYIGVKGGISIPNLTANGSQQNPVNTGYGSRLGPDFAIFFERGFSTAFSVMPHLEYSSQGGKKNGYQGFTTPEDYVALFPPGQAPQYLYADYKSEAKLNYLLLGILAKFNWQIRSASRFSVYLDVGPFGALLLSAHQITSGSSMIYADEQMQQPISPAPQSFDNNENVKSDLHEGNFGVQGDLGIAFSLKGGKFFLEGGGNYGFLNIQKRTENGKNHTGAATVRAGYAYNF